MAGNAVASLQIDHYPNGSDNSQRREILTGTLLIQKSSTAIIQITGWSITSNVVTFTAVNALTAGGGDVVTVQNFTGAYTFLNATFTVTAATATTFTASLTHANGSGSQSGVGVIQGSYQTAGIPLNYTFTNMNGALAVPVLGGNPVPTWIEVKTKAGSAFNYKVNQTVTPNLLLIFNGVTQVSDAAAITADTVGFRAEFPRGV